MAKKLAWGITAQLGGSGEVKDCYNTVDKC